MITVILLFSTLALPFRSTTAQSPEQSVEPAAGYAGTEFTFFATGFGHNEQVSYWFNAPDGRVYGHAERYRATSYQGRIDWSWRAPDDAQPGMWSVVAQSGRTDGAMRVLSFEILPVESAPPATPAAAAASRVPASTPGAAVQPGSGPPGTRFAFFATGFQGNEKVAFWFNAPDGQIYADDYRYGVHAYDGRADWHWTSPGDGAPGVWTAVARGVRSGVERIIEFGVDAPTTSEGEVVTNVSGVAVEPLAGAPGSRFFFSASGFIPRETIRFRIYDPLGNEDENSKYKIRANEEGEAYWNWLTPSDAEHGIWRMFARGEESQTERSISFQVW